MGKCVIPSVSKSRSSRRWIRTHQCSKMGMSHRGAWPMAGLKARIREICVETASACDGIGPKQISGSLPAGGKGDHPPRSGSCPMKTLIATLALLCMIAAGTAEAGSKPGIASGSYRGSASVGHHGR